MGDSWFRFLPNSLFSGQCIVLMTSKRSAATRVSGKSHDTPREGRFERLARAELSVDTTVRETTCRDEERQAATLSEKAIGRFTTGDESAVEIARATAAQRDLTLAANYAHRVIAWAGTSRFSADGTRRHERKDGEAATTQARFYSPLRR